LNWLLSAGGAPSLLLAINALLRPMQPLDASTKVKKDRKMVKDEDKIVKWKRPE
jgi:hypothetical protein